MLKTIMIAAAAVALSGAAQADTVKQIWNQGLSEANPGRIESPSDCMQDDSSKFGCWNERSEIDVDSGNLGGAEEPEPEPEPEPDSQLE